MGVGLRTTRWKGQGSELVRTDDFTRRERPPLAGGEPDRRLSLREPIASAPGSKLRGGSRL